MICCWLRIILKKPCNTNDLQTLDDKRDFKTKICREHINIKVKIHNK